MRGRRPPPGAGVALFLAVAGLVAASRPAPLPAGVADGFDVLGFFDGAARSTGSVTTLLVFRRDFTARFAGRAENGTLRLAERFRFADGREPLQRWTLTRRPGGVLAGTVETEDGAGRLAAPVPVEGRLTRDGAVLDYRGFAPGGGALALDFRHAMTRLDGDRVANRVTVRLLGWPIATSDVVFARGDGAKPSAID